MASQSNNSSEYDIIIFPALILAAFAAAGYLLWHFFSKEIADVVFVVGKYSINFYVLIETVVTPEFARALVFSHEFEAIRKAHKLLSSYSVYQLSPLELTYVYNASGMIFTRLSALAIFFGYWYLLRRLPALQFRESFWLGYYRTMYRATVDRIANPLRERARKYKKKREENYEDFVADYFSDYLEKMNPLARIYYQTIRPILNFKANKEAAITALSKLLDRIFPPPGLARSGQMSWDDVLRFTCQYAPQNRVALEFPEAMSKSPFVGEYRMPDSPFHYCLKMGLLKESVTGIRLWKKGYEPKNATPETDLIISHHRDKKLGSLRRNLTLDADRTTRLAYHQLGAEWTSMDDLLPVHQDLMLLFYLAATEQIEKYDNILGYINKSWYRVDKQYTLISKCSIVINKVLPFIPAVHRVRKQYSTHLIRKPNGSIARIAFDRTPLIAEFKKLKNDPEAVAYIEGVARLHRWVKPTLEALANKGKSFTEPARYGWLWFVDREMRLIINQKAGPRPWAETSSSWIVCNSVKTVTSVIPRDLVGERFKDGLEYRLSFDDDWLPEGVAERFLSKNKTDDAIKTTGEPKLK